jgi:hypothetical protein
MTIRVAACIAATTMLASGCGSREQPAPPRTGQLVSLLNDGTLLTLDLAVAGARPEQRRIGGATTRGAGKRLAWNAGRSVLYAIVGRGRRFELAIIDRASWNVTRRVDLGARGRFGSVVVGPRSRRLFLFGSRRGDPVMRILRSDGRLIREATARNATLQPWDVIDGAVSGDERYAFLSYHGAIDGVDRLDVATGRLACERRNPGGGCLRAPVHGYLELHGDRVVATTTGHELLLLSTADDEGFERVPTGLEGNHMAHFALTPSGALFAAGSCLVVGGFSTAARLGARPKLLVPIDYQEASTSGKACGERLAVGGRPLTGALAQRLYTESGDTIRGAIAIVDPATGRVRRTLELDALPEDVLVAP